MEKGLKKSTRIRWSFDDEIQLLEIWNQYETDLRQCKRNSHIYIKIAEEMGARFSSLEIHTKISNMIQRYRKEKMENCPSIWAHYDAVEKILEHNNAIKNEKFSVAESIENDQSMSNSTFEESDPLLSNSPEPPFSFSRELPALISSRRHLESEPEAASNSVKRKRGCDDDRREIIQSLKRQTELGEEQLKILRSVAENTRQLCEYLGTYMRQQQENDRFFMKCFKKLVEKD